MTGYQHCKGCNTRWVETGCPVDGVSEADWHARCPHRCSICALPITGRPAPDACPGHTRGEHDEFMAQICGRVTP